MNKLYGLLLAGSLILPASFSSFAFAQDKPFIRVNENGQLVYTADPSGNRVIDFSYAGYHASSDSIPFVDPVVYLQPQKGDNSARLQQAIDYVSKLPVRKDGFRGAVLLGKGDYVLTESLRITASGVVLRGSGTSETRLIKKGVDRGALIYLEGSDDIRITDTLDTEGNYVPVNGMDLTLNGNDSQSIKTGDRIMIVRPSTEKWIKKINCDHFGGGITALGWKPGDADLIWRRNVNGVEGNRISIDAPITMALDPSETLPVVLKYEWPGQIQECGVENMTLVSDYDTANLLDEDHCWTGISVASAQDSWIRQVNFLHFAGSAVALQSSASCITVQDCNASHPVSENGGLRRMVFHTSGQQTLFQRCFSENGRNDFSAGYCATGPNAFVQCASSGSLGESGSTDICATGLLFDIVNIDGHNLSFRNKMHNGNGVGWNALNSMFWQCSAADIDCFSASETEKNYAYGCWAQFCGDGEWLEANNHVKPRSLFYAQLAERTGKDHVGQSRLFPMNTNTTSSPTIDQAHACMLDARQPALTLRQWIDSAPALNIDPKGVKEMKDKTLAKSAPRSEHPDIHLVGGRIYADNQLLYGKKHDVPWWSGKLRSPALAKSKPHLTRFVPDREGWGYTDRVDSVISWMKRSQTLAIDHNYALWSERRRDDHERIRRRDGDVWGPFYDQPFARTGKGTAWDGLSCYDLTKPNKWYWSRLNEFARKGETEGLLLYHQHYFQHNILEAGAHWVDSPWRPVNNVNDTPFPEPVPFAGDKRIFMAEYFYNTSSENLRSLHRNYIRTGLEQLRGRPNVVHMISAEYTGPLHFVEFWLDVIAEWKKETGEKPLIALSTTRDVQDAILNDPLRRDLIDIIDIRYWHYNTDSIYAPMGGKHLAPRQHARKMKTGKVNFEQVYKAVSEYRERYPAKAVFYYGQSYSEQGWASAFAGGSCPVIPEVNNSGFLQAFSGMYPVKHSSEGFNMVKSDKGCIIYSHTDKPVLVGVDSGKYQIFSVDPLTGICTFLKNYSQKDASPCQDISFSKNSIYWFRKK